MHTVARRLATLGIIAILCLQAMPILAQSDVPVDEACHICCCMGDPKCANNYVTRVKELIPGVKTRIVERNAGKNDESFTVYDVYVKHDEMNLEEICGQLLELQENVCPDPDESTP